MANPYVFNLYEDRHTNLWAGTRGGLFRFDGRRFEPAQFLPQTNAFVPSLLEERRGAFWASTSQAAITPSHPGWGITVEKVGVDGAAVTLGSESSLRVRLGARRFEFEYPPCPICGRSTPGSELAAAARMAAQGAGGDRCGVQRPFAIRLRRPACTKALR